MNSDAKIDLDYIKKLIEDDSLTTTEFMFLYKLSKKIIRKREKEYPNETFEMFFQDTDLVSYNLDQIPVQAVYEKYCDHCKKYQKKMPLSKNMLSRYIKSQWGLITKNVYQNREVVRVYAIE